MRTAKLGGSGFTITMVAMATMEGVPIATSEGNSGLISIGVLALQGDYDAHSCALASSGARTVLVRKPEDLRDLDGLVMPGGESTTMLRFLERDGFLNALRKFLSITPCFATCAGCILLAREVLYPGTAQSRVSLI